MNLLGGRAIYAWVELLTHFEAVVAARWDAALSQAFVTLRVPAPVAASYTLAGQYLAVQTPEGTGYFALANVPGTPEFEFLVKQAGPVASWLAQASVGTAVQVSLAAGPGFAAQDVQAGAAVLLVAGGTGVTPLRPLWRQLWRQGVVPTLWYGAMQDTALAWRSELDNEAAQGRLTVRYFVSQGAPAGPVQAGQVTHALLKDALPYARLTAFLCGPDAMVADARTRLLAHGVAPDRVRTNL